MSTIRRTLLGLIPTITAALCFQAPASAASSCRATGWTAGHAVQGPQRQRADLGPGRSPARTPRRRTPGRRFNGPGAAARRSRSPTF